jgi:hypothetical protein
MIAIRDVRALALSLPEACEQDHHGIPSFRVRGKIFATVPDGEHVRVMADECAAAWRTSKASPSQSKAPGA